MSENRLEAVLWDLDGVIADTGKYHYLAWTDVFGKRGVNFTEKDFMRHFGRRHDTIIRFALGDGITPAEFDAITEEKQANYRRRVSRDIRALPGALELIRALNARKIKTAIASSAPLENIDIILGGLGIRDCFQAIAQGRPGFALGRLQHGVHGAAPEAHGAAPRLLLPQAVAGAQPQAAVAPLAQSVHR